MALVSIKSRVTPKNQWTGNYSITVTWEPSEVITGPFSVQNNNWEIETLKDGSRRLVKKYTGYRPGKTESQVTAWVSRMSGCIAQLVDQ